jgi:hypothetical protein
MLMDASTDDRLMILASQITDLRDDDGLVWIYDHHWGRYRIVSQDEALWECFRGKATLSEPRTTAISQGIVD